MEVGVGGKGVRGKLNESFGFLRLLVFRVPPLDVFPFLSSFFLFLVPVVFFLISFVPAVFLVFFLVVLLLLLLFFILLLSSIKIKISLMIFPAPLLPTFHSAPLHT